MFDIKINFAVTTIGEGNFYTKKQIKHYHDPSKLYEERCSSDEENLLHRNITEQIC